MYLDLLAPIEDLGIAMPESMTLDVSTGWIFSGYLRTKGTNPDGMQYYEHEFIDGRRPTVRARLYPIELLSDFKI